MTKTLLFTGLILFSLAANAQKHSAELISQRTNINIVSNKLIKTHFFEIRINNRGGEKYGKVTIPFSKLIKVTRVEAHINGPDGGTVRKLQKSEIIVRSSVSDFSLYEDDFIMEFTLKHNQYPYTVVYSYQSQQDQFLYIDQWLPVIDVDVPTYKAILTLSVPGDYRLDFLNNNITAPEISSDKDQSVYKWETSYTSFIRRETNGPLLTSLLPSVLIVPEKFRFDLEGSFASWQSYGSWQGNLLKGIDLLTETEKSRILSITKGIDDDKEKIKALYHYLQDETRYINITIETGGLKPYSALYVAENKYGDCKALTNYFSSVLAAAGIRSYYTKVYAGNPVKYVDKDFPSQQFNHIILFVPLASDSIWLDCTSDGPFNYLGTFTQNREAFLIDGENSRFLTTPKLTPSEVLERRDITIRWDYEKGSVMKFRNLYRGEMFENLLALDRSLNLAEKNRVIRNYFSVNGSDLIDFKIYGRDRDSREILFTYETSSRHIYKIYGNDILLSNIPFNIPDFEKPATRVSPVQIDHPTYRIDTLSYQIPPGYMVSNKLTRRAISNNYGKYELDVIESGTSIKVVKSMVIYSGFYPIEEYNDFYQFIHEIYESENQVPITLSK